VEKDFELYELDGFPSIKVYENHFEIKAIDYSKYRAIKYQEVKEIKFSNPANNSSIQILKKISGTVNNLSRTSPCILKIVLNNGGDWEYKTTNKTDIDFHKLLRILRGKLSFSN